MLYILCVSTDIPFLTFILCSLWLQRCSPEMIYGYGLMAKIFVLRLFRAIPVVLEVMRVSDRLQGLSVQIEIAVERPVA